MEESRIQKIEKDKALDIKVVKNILIIMVIPLVFYLIKLLSFIFIPLVSALFLSILFAPLMRWFSKKGVPKLVALAAVVIIICGFFKIVGELAQLSSQEMMVADKEVLLSKMELKLKIVVTPIEEFFGIDTELGDKSIHEIFKSNGDGTNLLSYFGDTLQFLQKLVTQLLMMFFFLVLLLAGSMDLQNLMKSTVTKRRTASIKTMLKIENSIVKFIKVKFLLSAFTGLGFGLACWGFDVSFPIFWGLFAFAINFVQMIGSIISTLALAIFSLAEIDSTGTIAIFCVIITGVQVLFGGILEPIMMGKTFSINTVTVLIMLMLWGYIWGVPGLIMSVPITVLVKIILEQNSRTEGIAKLMS